MSGSAEEAAGSAFDDYMDKVISSIVEIQVGDSPSAAASQVESVAFESLAPFAAPERIGRYPVSEMLGQGGIGVILRAHDPELGRELAVKLLRPEHADDAVLKAKFVDEARLCSSLQHPGVVPIYEIEYDEGGRPFFTMKVIEGATLHSMLAQRESPEADRARFLRYFEQVCETLSYAHARGIVHRDVKPGNVMVGAFGEVQVLDWGFAIELSSPASVPEASDVGGDRHGEKESGSRVRILGTPSYMAPEQARGDVEAIDARSDVFALGAILTEILTGAPAYRTSSRQESYVHASKAWLDDAHRRIERCDANREMKELALRCMAVAREERPADAGVVARAVREHLASLEQRHRELELEAAEARVRAEESLARARQEKRVRILTLACLAASIVAFLSIGAVVWAGQARERQAEEAQRSFLAAISQAKTLAAEARSAKAGVVAPWQKARVAAEQAATMARERSLDPRLVREGKDLLARVTLQGDRALRERRFLDWLEGPSHRLQYDRGSSGLEESYRAAFADLGIDIDAGASEVVPKPRESRIAAACIQALDDLLPYLRMRRIKRPSWTVLVEIANGADPQPQRVQIRRAWTKSDHAKLLELAASAELLREDPSGACMLATALVYSGKKRAARELWRKVIEFHPADYRAIHQLTVSLTTGVDRRRHADEILSLCQRGLALRPRCAHAWNHLYDALDGVEQLDRARAALERALELNPEDKHLQNTLEDAKIRIVERRGLFSRAFEARKASLAKREDSVMRCKLGFSLALAGRFDDGLEQLLRGRDLLRKDARGSWLATAEDWIRVLRSWRSMDRVLATLPPQPEAPDLASIELKRRALLGTVAVLTRRYELAAALFESVFAADSSYRQKSWKIAGVSAPHFELDALHAFAMIATAGEDAVSDAVRRRYGRRRAFEVLSEIVGRAEDDTAIDSKLSRSGAKRLLSFDWLEGLRGEIGLERHVPADERPQWRALWKKISDAANKPASKR